MDSQVDEGGVHGRSLERLGRYVSSTHSAELDHNSFFALWSVGTRNAVVTAEVNALPDDMRAKLRRIGEMPVFETEYGRAPRITGSLALEQDFLWGYGRTRVPLGIWHALRRMSAWIEPMLVAEWVRLTKT